MKNVESRVLMLEEKLNSILGVERKCPPPFVALEAEGMFLNRIRSIAHEEAAKAVREEIDKAEKLKKARTDWLEDAIKPRACFCSCGGTKLCEEYERARNLNVNVCDPRKFDSKPEPAPQFQPGDVIRHKGKEIGIIGMVKECDDSDVRRVHFGYVLDYPAHVKSLELLYRKPE